MVPSVLIFCIMVFDQLIGKQFTRKKYGVQDWIKQIDKTKFVATLRDDRFFDVRLLVIATDGSEYYMDEIVLV